MMKGLDQLDQKLLNRIREHPGNSVRETLRPFLLERSETALRERLRALELRQMIRLMRTKQEVRCFKGESFPSAEGALDV